VSADKSCRVLYLRLEDLQVKLLGLDLNTSTLTVQIHGDDQRVLGRLFCRLAQAISLDQVTGAAGVTRSVNRRLARRPLQVLRMQADLVAQQAQTPSPGQAPSCALLDLTLGPLNLDLLGLVVDVYGKDTTQPVRVIATADPNGGVLGATLCRLANGQANTLPALPGVATPLGTGTVSASRRRATVNVRVDRFAAQGHHLVAQGVASSSVLTRDGIVRRQTKQVSLTVGAGDSCRVLYLRLDDLHVRLLGLDLNTSTITVRIKGDKSAVLGRLFCQLSDAIRLQRVGDAPRIARSLNHQLDGKPMNVLGLRTALNAQTAQQPPAPDQTTTCPLLDLTLGPLNLDLLGLVVDLYGADNTKPVRVVATADPNGGVLGATLCKLANGQAVTTP